ncbi:MAG: exodeoxyribonuclease VII small subunit [Lachnospiraceae bacterium]|jgi:exodeoxyribonuclease VII small subunit|nr:exodeoxyribonuclease VII small subunit [Lachnospiraceae bacterium]
MAEEKKELTIEESFAELDEMVKKMDSEDISLEESFRLYEEGMKLLLAVGEKIDAVEKKMQALMPDGGEVPFE